MPFNGAGVYSPPATDFPAISGTLIQATKFNNVMNDIATALSTCITVNGQSVVTANIPFGGFYATNAGIRAIAGAVGAPGISWNSDPSSGWYRIAANDYGLSIAGTKVQETIAASHTFSQNVLFSADNTYDIGAVGATRARDFFLGRNATIGGTLGVAGITTLAALTGTTAAFTKATSGDVLTFTNGGATPVTGYFYSDSVQAAFSNATSGGGESIRLDNQSHITRFFGGSTAAEQVRINHTASATRYITLAGSNGGNPSISTSAGILNIGTNLQIGSGSSASLSASGCLDVTNDIGITATNGIIVGATRIAAFTASSMTLAGNLTVSGTGPHAIGGATNATTFLKLLGTFSGGTVGLDNSVRLQPAAASSSHLVYIGGTIDKAGSGTHADFNGVLIDQFTITAGAATLTNATGLKIQGAPSVGTNQRALWVAAGLSSFDAVVQHMAGAAGSPAIYFSSDTTTGFYRPSNQCIGFCNGAVEVFRLDGAGYLRQKDAGSFRNNLYNELRQATNTNPVASIWNADTSGNNIFLDFGTEAAFTSRGTIDYNRGGAAVRYNTTSDIRLKSDRGVVRKARHLDNLQVHDFAWKETGYADFGLFAQEAWRVWENPVSVRDEGYWGIDYSKYVPDLIAGYQEHQDELRALRAEVAELRSKLQS